jgi:hypothetical protein
VTIYSTVEVVEGHRGLQFTGQRVSFLTDDIISQRYVEIEGTLRKALVVVKMRGSDHSRDFRTYEITGGGVQLRESLRDFDDIISGTPTRKLRIATTRHQGLTEHEVLVLETVVRSGEMSPTEVADRTGLPQDDVDQVLERLLQLEYVSRQGTQYRAEARPEGPWRHTT